MYKEKRYKPECKNEENLDAKTDVNMGAIVDTKLVENLDKSKVDVKVDSKWNAININNI